MSVLVKALQQDGDIGGGRVGFIFRPVNQIDGRHLTVGETRAQHQIPYGKCNGFIRPVAERAVCIRDTRGGFRFQRRDRRTRLPLVNSPLQPINAAAMMNAIKTTKADLHGLARSEWPPVPVQYPHTSLPFLFGVTLKIFLYCIRMSKHLLCSQLIALMKQHCVEGFPVNQVHDNSPLRLKVISSRHYSDDVFTEGRLPLNQNESEIKGCNGCAMCGRGIFLKL